MCSLISWSESQLESSFQSKGQRCGEVSISLAIPSLTLHCIFCAFQSDSLETFLSHLQIQHQYELVPRFNSLPDELPIASKVKQEVLEVQETIECTVPDNVTDPLLPEKTELNELDTTLRSEDESYSSESTDFAENGTTEFNRPKVEHICRIIHYFREHPVLWDTHLYTYYVESEQQAALQSVAKKLMHEYPTWTVDLKYIRKKINHFKTIYRHFNGNKKSQKITKNDFMYYELLNFLKEHVEVKKSGKGFCKLCNTHVYKLTTHMLKNHIPCDTTYTCDTCLKVLPSDRLLEKHYRLVHKRYKCHHCDREPFSNAHCLRAHEISQHPEQRPNISYNKPAICEYCGMQFKKSVNLRKHMKLVHLQIRAYACVDCPKKFPTNEKLKSHRNSKHLNLRCHVCEVCGKGFFDRKTLLQHKRLHSDVKDYVCNVCSQAFRQAPALHSHMKTHA